MHDGSGRGIGGSGRGVGSSGGGGGCVGIKGRGCGGDGSIVGDRPAVTRVVARVPEPLHRGNPPPWVAQPLAPVRREVGAVAVRGGAAAAALQRVRRWPSPLRGAHQLRGLESTNRLLRRASPDGSTPGVAGTLERRQRRRQRRQGRQRRLYHPPSSCHRRVRTSRCCGMTTTGRPSRLKGWISCHRTPALSAAVCHTPSWQRPPFDLLPVARQGALSIMRQRAFPPLAPPWWALPRRC